MTESVQDRAKEEITSDLPEFRQSIQELQRLGSDSCAGVFTGTPIKSVPITSLKRSKNGRRTQTSK